MPDEALVMSQRSFRHLISISSEDIKHQKCRMICIDDDIENKEYFEIIRIKLDETFRALLPMKSSFEKE